MEFKRGLFLVILIVGCTASPTPVKEDMSFFFKETDPATRIVGGTQAPAGSHPHMVALSTGVLVRSFFCGGSLVGPRTVLTAAHCIASVFSFGSLSNSLRATVGTLRWNQGGTAYTISRNITHPNYVSATIKNDIGILLTTSNVVYTAAVQPIPLSYDFVGEGVEARVAGWGRISTNGAISAVLLEVTVPTIDGDQCVADAAAASINFAIRAPAVEPHIELCTFHSAGRGTCRGDSGSALARIDTGNQIGVVSWGFPCARGAPDMFVRVSGFQDWLQGNIV